MAEDSATLAEMETVPQPRTTILKIAVIVMGIMLLAGFALVVTTIVRRASNPEQATLARALANGQFGSSDVRIAPGETVKSFSMNEDRIAIHIVGNAGEQIILVNLKTGQEIGRIHLRVSTDYAGNDRN